jgi:hypothetical protein
MELQIAFNDTNLNHLDDIKIGIIPLLDLMELIALPMTDPNAFEVFKTFIA